VTSIRALAREDARRATGTSVAGSALWSDLVKGRWSLVDDEDDGGQRHILAVRNDAFSDVAALTKGEARAVDLAIRGHSTKQSVDALGVRYVDKDHHHRCEASRASHTVRIVTCRDGAETVDAQVTWNGSFNDVGMQFRAVEDTLDCTVGGVTVTATGESNFHIGKMGMYNHYNRGGRFDWTGAPESQEK
jgi:hypothetical protein